jgi:hypothetical protein
LTTPEQPSGVPQAPPPSKKPFWKRPLGIAVIAVAVLIALGAIGSLMGDPSEPGATASPEGGGETATPSAASPTEQPTDASTEEPAATSSPPEDGVPAAAVGEPVEVDGLTVTIEEVAFSDGFEFQDPPSGYVFVAYKVRLEASEDERFVSSADFTVANQAGEQGSTAFVVNEAWEPLLTLDTLNAGNSLTGWITFEVPEGDEVVLTYSASFFENEPAFELRSPCCG